MIALFLYEVKKIYILSRDIDPDNTKKRIYYKTIRALISKSFMNTRERAIRKFKYLVSEAKISCTKESVDEKINHKKLHQNINRLKHQKILCEGPWCRFRERLLKCLRENDPRNFLHWYPVTESMFFSPSKNSLERLKNKNWNIWEPAIQNCKIGNPPTYRWYKQSNGNIIQMANNLSELFDNTDADLKKMRTIVEFGGGYGCMTKLIFDLGFTGEYTLFDIPEFLTLQKYFLRSARVNGNFQFVDSIDKLNVQNPDLVIATWSLSESPFELRNAFLKKIKSPNYFLIAYQENFKTIDNKKYFDDFRVSRSEYDWIDYEAKDIPKNHFLIGIKQKIKCAE